MDRNWLEALSLLVPAPLAPAVGDASWPEVEQQMGVRFPPDFRRLVDTYGFGSIGDELMVLSPRSSAFGSWTAPSLEAISELGPEGCNSPLAGFPAAGPSLLPIATNGNGDEIYMVVTEGHADEMRLWVGNIRNLEWLLVPGPVSRVLCDLLTGGETAREVIRTFGSRSWTLKPTFTPKAMPEQ